MWQVKVEGAVGSEWQTDWLVQCAFDGKCSPHGQTCCKLQSGNRELSFLRLTHDFLYVCVHMYMCVCSVMSDSLQPPGLPLARLLCSWEFPGKNTAGDWTQNFCVSCTGRQTLHHWATREGRPHFPFTKNNLSHQGHPLVCKWSYWPVVAPERLTETYPVSPHSLSHSRMPIDLLH